VDNLVDYRDCVATSRWNFLPMFNRLGPCRHYYDRWISCQSNREFDIKERRKSSLKLIESDEHD
jgi:hypothetical protein